MEVFEPGEKWSDLVRSAWAYDIYHLPNYHRLAQSHDEGRPLCFALRENEDFIALPLLIRSLERVPGGNGFFDASSVYGYCGPVFSRPNLPEALLDRFRRDLRDELQRRKIVTVFSRLHPLIPQDRILEGLGSCLPGQETVSIDLEQPLEIQRAGYRKDHRRTIKRLEAMGITCTRDKERKHLEVFVDLYHQTMRRVEAAPMYHFGADYFHNLFEILGAHAHLFLVWKGSEILAGGIDLTCGGIVECHLAGTSEEGHRLAASKVLLDTERIWATRNGFKVLHLGGGRGQDSQDPLFQFKSGFSKIRHRFQTWRWILDSETHRRLCRPGEADDQQALRPEAMRFFPAYRTAILA